MKHFLAMIASAAQVLSLVAAFTVAPVLSTPAAAQPCQWNYALVNNLATATYCGVVQSASGITLTSVADIPDMEALPSPIPNQTVSVAGNRGGIFVFSASTVALDGCVNFPPAVGTGTWVRQFNAGNPLPTSFCDTLAHADTYGAAHNGIDVNTIWTLTAPTTLASKIINFSGAGKIVMAGNNLTINANLSAPIGPQIFDLGGGSVLGNIQTPTFWVSWFGAPGDGTVADETAAIQGAINTASLNSFSGAVGVNRVGLNSGTHPVTTLNLVGHNFLQFVTNGFAYIEGTGTTYTAILNANGGTTTVTRNLIWDENIAVITGPGAAYAYALDMSFATDWTVNKILFDGDFYSAIIRYDYSFENLFQNLYFLDTNLAANGWNIGGPGESANALTVIGGRMTSASGSTGAGVNIGPGSTGITFINPDLSGWFDCVRINNLNGGVSIINPYTEDNAGAIIHFTGSSYGVNLEGGRYSLNAETIGILIDAGKGVTGLSAHGIKFDVLGHPVVDQRSLVNLGSYLNLSNITGNYEDAPNNLGVIINSQVQDGANLAISNAELQLSNIPTSAPTDHCTLWNSSGTVHISTCP